MIDNADQLKLSSNYNAWRAEILTPSLFWGLSSEEERARYLASLGHLAANSHNTQPWQFSFDVENSELVIWLDTQRVLPISDVKGRQAVISVGCALANIEIALSYYSADYERYIYISEVQTIRSDLQPIKVAGYRLTSKDELFKKENCLFESEVLFKAIFTRRTERGEYDQDRKLEGEIFNYLKEIGTNENISTILITDWGRKVALAELQQQADSFGINNPKFAEELVNGWIIENDSDIELGMPGDTFKLSDEQTIKIKNRFKIGLGLESDDVTTIAQLGKKGILSSQCVGLLTVENDKPEEWLKAGITLQKGALYLESKGVSWAVHAGLAEVSQVNIMMLRPIAMTTKKPAVLYRAGFLKQTASRSPHSPRLQFDKVWRVK